jgi:hypothetical protein
MSSKSQSLRQDCKQGSSLRSSGLLNLNWVSCTMDARIGVRAQVHFLKSYLRLHRWRRRVLKLHQLLQPRHQNQQLRIHQRSHLSTLELRFRLVLERRLCKRLNQHRRQQFLPRLHQNRHRRLEVTSRLVKLWKPAHHNLEPLCLQKFKCIDIWKLGTLNSTYTDTFFASWCDCSGATCVQVFYGCTSKMINVYGMNVKRKAPSAYQDFICEEGAPTLSYVKTIQSFRQAKHSKRLINRKFAICDGLIDPYHPQQNGAEMYAISCYSWVQVNHSRMLCVCVAVCCQPPYL